MEICDLSDFDDWPLKKESTDIWEELDATMSTFETNQFLGGRGTKCTDRMEMKRLPLPRSVTPDCNKIIASAWNSHPQKPPSHQLQQQEHPKNDSAAFIRPSCRPNQPGGRVITEAWPARIVPRKQDHDYSQHLSLSQQALGVHAGSQGRIGTIDLCCDNFCPIDGLPEQKAGKFGAPWRHVKSATGAAGQQFAYVDGSVKIRDGCVNDWMSAGGDGKPWSASSSSFYSSCKFLRPNYIQAPKTLDNGYAERAREGFVYWYVDRKPQLCGGGSRSRRGKCR